MTLTLCNKNSWLLSEEAFRLYSPCMYKPTFEKFTTQMSELSADPLIKILKSEDDRTQGILILKIEGTTAEIVGIAVSENRRRSGIGRSMILEAMQILKLMKVTAQTDDDAVEFYRRCGFDIRKKTVEYPDGIVTRYDCVLS